VVIALIVAAYLFGVCTVGYAFWKLSQRFLKAVGADVR
jgi:hypothetical protein